MKEEGQGGVGKLGFVKEKKIHSDGSSIPRGYRWSSFHRVDTQIAAAVEKKTSIILQM